MPGTNMTETKGLTIPTIVVHDNDCLIRLIHQPAPNSVGLSVFKIQMLDEGGMRELFIREKDVKALAGCMLDCYEKYVGTMWERR